MNKTPTTADPMRKHYATLLDARLEGRADLTVEGFEPFVHHLLVQPLPPDETVGELGIIQVPEKHQEPKAIGVVVKVNPADAGGPFAEGDLVLFADSAGQDIRLANQDFKILQWHTTEESDILGRWPAARSSACGQQVDKPQNVV